MTKVLGKPGDEIRFYMKDYDREIRRSWKVSRKRQLLDQILNSEVVFGADFHAHAQAQRTHLRILRSIPKNKKIILALECFESADQKTINLYFDEKITEAEFLKQISWNKKWGFSWQHYKPLITLAKKRGYEVVGLNKYHPYTSRFTLASREEHAAKVLAKKIKSKPKALTYVVFGELHLSRRHLPLKLEKKLKRKVESIVVFQNSERVYFDLVKTSKDLVVDVVQFDERTFCIINSPPWVKWQSYLYFLEESTGHFFEDEFSEHIYEAFVSQLELIKTEFKVKLDTHHLNIKNPDSLDLSGMIRNNKLSRNEIKLIRSYVQTGQSFIIPHLCFIYVSRSSLNNVSSMAGKWLHASYSHRQNWVWVMPNDFLKLIWIEAIGFFCSKILNPGRKLETLEDLTNIVSRNPKNQVDVLKLCLSFKHYELSKKSVSKKWNYKPRHRSSYDEASKKLGAMMGEQMFWGYRNGTIRRRLALDWLKMKTDDPSFETFYYNVSRLLNQLPVLIKSKEERL